jgi:TolB-like protein/Tfp pilus assembly protein PilF
MADNPTNFWQELKRRRVIRVIPVYAAAAFVLLELADIVSEPLGLPSWTINFLLVLLSIGLVLSIILSWIYDITPEGVKKTKPITTTSAQETAKVDSSKSWRIATFVSIIVIVGLLLVNIFAIEKVTTFDNDLEKSIAVLPFDNMSIGEEFEHLGDAFTDEIILELQKIKEFDRVLSRSSTMQYKNDRPTVPEMAEKLGVNYLIEGSIQRNVEEVSIRVQVIRAINEDHVWADEYNRKWENIFAIQDEIALNVAHELKAALAPEEISRIDKQPTDNPEAYNLYLQGRFHWQKRTEEGLRKSVNYFEKAIEVDPEYALAFAGLADSYFIQAWYGWTPWIEGMTRAKEYALQAISIDSNLAEAHTVLGAVLEWHDWDFKEAQKEFLLAIEFNPNYATAHLYYSELLNILRKNVEARLHINIALELDPFWFINKRHSAFCYYCEGKLEESLNEYYKLRELNPDDYRSYWRPFNIYVKQGEELKAVEALQNALLRDTATAKYKDYVNELYNKSGIYGLLNFLIELEYDKPVPSEFSLAIRYAMLGEKEKTLDLLEKILEEKNHSILYINTRPEFDFLRYDPRFQALLKKMNFPLPKQSKSYLID